MSRRKVKFTKRLSVRLTALAAVLALGALAIAGAGFKPADGEAEDGAASDGGPETSSAAPLMPIPDIDDAGFAFGSLPDTATPDAASNAGGESDAASSEDRFTPPVFSMPSPDETVIRGNDGGEVVQASAEESIAQPASIYERSGGFDGPEANAPPTEVPSFPALGGSPAPAGPESSVSASATVADSPDLIGQNAIPAAESARSASPMPETPAAPVAASGGGWGDAPSYGATPSDAAVAAAGAGVGFAASRFESAAADSSQSVAPETSAQPPTLGNATYENTPNAQTPPPLRPAPAALQPAPATGGFAGATTQSPSASFGAGEDATAVATGIEGDGMPGTEVIEGLQTPSLTVEKMAPSEIQVGKETEFGILVRNVGNVAAHDVVIFDRIPRGTRYVSSQPAATRTPEGQLMWEAGTLQPGDERAITIQLLPIAEGEIGSVAQVLFQSQASVRTICTKPELAIKHTGPQKVLIGENVTLNITISNPGTGAATSVVLEEDVPEGLIHAAGRELEREIGVLRPGDTRQMELTLTADKPGRIQNVVLVRGDGNLIAQDILDIEVVAPELTVAISGPRLRYLDRPATYEVAVANPGTAPAREVELVTYLPKGMKFVSADKKGVYEPSNHAVYWSLEELPANQNGSAELELLPLEIGEQKISLEGRAALGLQHADEQTVQVDSLAELQLTIADEHDPIEIGAETTYVITLTNSGSSAATDIQLTAALPPQLQAVGGDGPTRVVVDDGRLAIDPLARLGAGEQAIYKIRVQGLDAGPQRLQVQLITAETPVPVTMEEITRVYSDE